MERKKRLELTRWLEHRGFRPADDMRDGCDGEVTTMTKEDGVYFNFSSSPDEADMIQLLIVGPMHNRPEVYADLVGHGYAIKSSEFLKPAGADAKRKVLDRGFISLILSAE